MHNDDRKLVMEKIRGRMAQDGARRLRVVEGAEADSEDPVVDYLAALERRSASTVGWEHITLTGHPQ